MLHFIHELELEPSLSSRKSDIENERLPPELYDVASNEGKAIISQPTTPEGTPAPPPSANGIAKALDTAIAVGSAPQSPVSPTSPLAISTAPFKRGHGRQASLGTTMTSPSTRRRSIESTMSLIKEAYDVEHPVQDSDLVKLADQVADQSTKSKGGGAPA